MSSALPLDRLAVCFEYDRIWAVGCVSIHDVQPGTHGLSRRQQRLVHVGAVANKKCKMSSFAVVRIEG